MMKTKNWMTWLCLLMMISSLAQAQNKESLIPFPQKLDWKSGNLDLKNGILLGQDDPEFKQELNFATSILKEKGIRIANKSNVKNKASLLLIRDSNAHSSLGKEGYKLVVDAKGIRLTAATAAGIFYGLQTLNQFQFNAGKIPYVEIEDRPAYSVRGFLLDVGRNFQSVEMIKEQIDYMAKYKLNLLHFHFTEDIAWRLESKKYPGLTDANNMTRWAGKSYSTAEFREIIQYCTDRHIQFLPEIDMPGHSAAFERFFGVSMQSEEGIIKIKELLQEFAENFPELRELHIGGDEVKINNKNFMPEITAFVESLGLKTYGWEPGSNLQDQTIRQLWMGGATAINKESKHRYIDSKHLYINHMDPLETVTTLFFRQFAEQPAGSPQLPGAILCSWPDRAVAKPEDMFLQSAIYPAILTFGERSWRGAGETLWKANLPLENTASLQAFQEFEERLLNHKDRYFQHKPFPYVKHSQLRWELVGPFDNQGNLMQEFPIEQEPFAKQYKPSYVQPGGTVILRHWWADVIAGVIADPKSNSTWYARTKIWSETDGTQNFWIGFNNLSRSYASDSPNLGTWDDRGSQVWVNAQRIAPPHWKQAGQKGAMEIPLMDEGYSFREPTSIALKKGWNDVLIKLPVAKIAGKDWQNPLKWMFTFVPYH